MFPTLFRPADRYEQAWSGIVIVLAPGTIPTVDFYLTPRLSGLPEDSVFRFDSRTLPGPALLPAGAFVVIVRHAAPTWLHLLQEQRSSLSGVAFLMDDDIPAAWRCADVPLDYGLWTTGRYMRVRHLLSRVCDRVWVSTHALWARYPGARVVPPLEFCPARSPAPPGTRRWGYHGTRIHDREAHWLLPVVKAVQNTVPDAEFEIFGGGRIVRQFAGIPRVRVLPPVPWPAYVAHCLGSNLAVGVAPLLPGHFNAARSHTKFFDITRCGAVGVFSAREPYASALAPAGASLLADDPGAWSEEITRLLTHDTLRMERHRAAAAWVNGNRQGDISALIEGHEDRQ